ncbi:MAG: MATE family efflux transporter, partial [Oscillospiraceae bacterium]
MEKINHFTEGSIIKPLLKFTIPVVFALLLQIMYGAVDLIVVGKFGTVGDVSGVTTGSQLMSTLTNLFTGLAMGTTILLGQKIGQKKQEEAGDIVGSGICLFAAMAVIGTIVMLLCNGPLVSLMQAPPEALEQTASYVFICSCGIVFIIAYNVLGSVFRGIGDSKTPLIAVAIACAANVIGDLILVWGFKMGASGAAIATVAAQGLSVVLSLLMLRRRKLPFAFSLSSIRFNWLHIGRIIKLGTPIAMQSVLVSISFLAVTAIVNVLGVVPSAAVGVSEKLSGFIMLIPLAFMQSMSAFVAQNFGARRLDRAKKAMGYGMLISFIFGAIMAYVSFFHGDFLAWLFNKDPEVIAATALYMKAYAFDTVLVPFLFCFTGFFNGCGRTSFVMAQAIIGSIGIRIPLSYLFSRGTEVSLFRVGLATPSSTAVQITLCLIYFIILNHRLRRRSTARLG